MPGNLTPLGQFKTVNRKNLKLVKLISSWCKLQKIWSVQLHIPQPTWYKQTQEIDIWRIMESS